MARKAKEFNESSKLGFMRLIQVFNIIVVAGNIAALVLIRGRDVVFNYEVVTHVILLVMQAAVIWLIAKRKLYTRQIIICIEVFEIVVYAIGELLAGTFSIPVFIVGSIPPLVIILYFAYSKRAKAVLVQPWNGSTLNEIQEQKEHELWDPKSVEFWMRLAIYFFVFSILGHWMEMGVQILVVNGLFPGTVAGPDSLTWRDSLNPFPIYGIAVVFCGLALYPAFLALRSKLPYRWQAYAISFLLNMAFCVAAELVLGFLFNADYHAWDYRDQFMNFEGQVCLLYSIAFGIASSIITWFIYPLLERVLGMMRRDVFRMIFGLSALVYAMIMAAYNIDIPELIGMSDSEYYALSSQASSSLEVSSQAASSLQQAA